MGYPTSTGTELLPQNFLIPISSQPDDVNLWYIILFEFDLTEFYSLKYQRFTTLDWDKKIRVCCKNLVPLDVYSQSVCPSLRT